MILLLIPLVITRKLGSYHHILPNPSLGQPLPDPLLTLLVLIPVGGIDVIPTHVEVSVEEFAGGCLGHGSEG